MVVERLIIVRDTLKDIIRLNSQAIAEYAASVAIEELPPEVVTRTQELVLDAIGCSIGAYTSPPSKILRRRYRGYDGSDTTATVFGSGDEIAVEYAALINSAMVRYLDFNDVYIEGHGGAHPSDHIPALISVAEAEGASGAELIEAIVLAYDIQCTGTGTGVLYQRGYDPQSVWTAYSGVAAVGKLMGLTESQLTNAIGIAGTSGNGLLITRRGDVSMWKGVAAPYTIHNAIRACQMAQLGLTGPSGVFDGPCGIEEVISGEEIHVDSFEDPHRVMQTSIKPVVGCYLAHAAISGLLDLVEEHDISATAVTEINVETYPQAIAATATPEKWNADLSRETADHSIPYMLAVALLDGELTTEQYADTYLKSDEVYELMQRVSVEEDEELTRFREENPASIPARLEIETEDETVETRVDFPPGHYERPMSDAQLEQKFRGLTDAYLTADQIQDVLDACSTLESLEHVDQLTANLTV